MTEEGAENSAWHEIRWDIAGEGTKTPDDEQRDRAVDESEDAEETETASGEVTEERWQEMAAAAI